MLQHHTYALFSARFAPYTGGVESFTLNIGRQLVEQGNSVVVVTKRIDGSPERETRDDGVEVIRLPTKTLVNDRLPLSKRTKRHYDLLAEVARKGADRVLVNNRFYPHSLDGLQFAKSIDAPAILIDHGSAYLTLGNCFADFAIRRYEHAITRQIRRYNPVYVGISHKSAEWLRTFGISTRFVAPNAIDAQEYRQCSSGRNFRNELGFGRKDRIVAFAGRLTPEKGPDKVIAVANQVSDKGWKFIIAGEGMMRESLEARAGDNVRFTGSIQRADMSALLQSADVFCLPSRSEGFCTSLLEAAACGTPAIITNVGGAQEVIPDPSYGLIIQDASPQSIEAGLETMRQLGHEGRRNMGQRVQKHVEQNCSWSSTIAAIEAAFTCAEEKAGGEQAR